MMRKYLLLSVLFLLPCKFLLGINIKGNASQYANTALEVYKLADHITRQQIVLGSCKVDARGNFLIDFKVDKTTQVFMDMGIYRMFLFVEPNKSYELILPERTDKTKAEELNPYFKPTNVHLATKNSDDKELNIQIRMFEDIFLPFFNKHIQHLLSSVDFSTLEDDINSIEKNFKKSDNQFFNQYRQYRYGFIRYVATQRHSKNINDDLFTLSNVLYNNPAYWELFDNIYGEYFRHIARTEQGKRIGNDIAISQNIDSLRQTIMADGNIQSDDLADIIILKGLYTEFYDDNYSRSALLKVLKGLSENPSNTENKFIAETMYSKVTKLLVGYAPPELNLYDFDSNLVLLNDLKGKYVYLNFCSCFSYSCLIEFAKLNMLHQKHRQYLDIVTVFVDNDVEKVIDLVTRSNYKWKFLHYGNNVDVINEYDIRAYPTYYLLDTQGRLKLSPAPTPNDQFEGRLFKILRAEGVL